MVAKLHTVGRLQLVNGGGNDVIAVLGASIDYADITSFQNHSGLEHATNLLRTGAQVPMVRVTCYFKDAYDILGLNGSVLTSGEWVLELAQTSAAVVDSGSTHTHYSSATGVETLAYIDSMRVSETEAATCEVVLMPFSADGTTDPITTTASNSALSALTAIPAIHSVGPVTLNNTVYDGLKGITYNSGMQVTVAGHHDGNPYITGGTRAGQQPTITVEHDDPVTLETILASIGAAISSTTKVRLLKAPASGVLTTSGALDLTIGTGYIGVQTAQGAHGERFTTGIVLRGVSSNGSTHPVAVSTVA